MVVAVIVPIDIIVSIDNIVSMDIIVTTTQPIIIGFVETEIVCLLARVVSRTLHGRDQFRVLFQTTGSSFVNHLPFLKRTFELDGASAASVARRARLFVPSQRALRPEIVAACRARCRFHRSFATCVCPWF
jgi:hypothetical protein